MALSRIHYKWFAHFCASHHLDNSAVLALAEYFKANNSRFDKDIFLSKVEEDRTIMREYANFIK